MNRVMSDRFWPIFLACLAIGFAEVAAVAAVCLGEQGLAKELDAYWWLGLGLSMWLWPDSSSKDTGLRANSIWNRSWAQASALERLALAGIFLALVFVCTVGWLLSPPWPIVVRGVTVGPYLLALCRSAWKRDPATEQPLHGVITTNNGRNPGHEPA
jgi:hypothetical protein